MAIDFTDIGVENSVEFQEEQCEKFARNNDIPLVDIYAQANKYYDENLEKTLEGLESDDDIQKAKESLKAKSLIRGRSIFKRKALKLKRVKQNGVSAFILFRFRDQDFSRSAWEKVDNYIREKNISDEKAKEHGLMDDDGDYLYTSLTTSFSDQHGKKIDKDYIIGSAVGFIEVEKDGQKDYEARFLRIGYAGNKYVPICRPSKVVLKEGTSPGPILTDKLYFYNDGIEEVNEMMTPLSLANYIGKLCDDLLDSDLFVDSYDEVIDLAESLIENHEKWGYIGVKATCSSVGQFSDPTKNIPVEFELYEDDKINTITTFVPPKHFEGMPLIEGTTGLLILVNPYFDKEGEAKFHLGGFMPIGGE